MRVVLSAFVGLAGVVGCASQPEPYAAQRAERLNAAGDYAGEAQMLRIALHQTPASAYEQRLDLEIRLARADACQEIRRGGTVPDASQRLASRTAELKPHTSFWSQERLARTVADLEHAQSEPRPWARVRCYSIESAQFRAACR